MSAALDRLLTPQQLEDCAKHDALMRLAQIARDATPHLEEAPRIVRPFFRVEDATPADLTPEQVRELWEV